VVNGEHDREEGLCLSSNGRERVASRRLASAGSAMMPAQEAEPFAHLHNGVTCSGRSSQAALGIKRHVPREIERMFLDQSKKLIRKAGHNPYG
jgi:hypothetical protein